MRKALKRGFELLKIRPAHDVIDIRSLERQFEVKIPTAYRRFCKTFYLRMDITDFGELNNLEVELIYEPRENEILVDEIFPLEFSLSTFREYEFWEERGFMFIASGPSEGGILLSLNEDNADAIFYNDGNSYVKLAANIFEFFQNLVLVESGE